MTGRATPYRVPGPETPREHIAKIIDPADIDRDWALDKADRILRVAWEAFKAQKGQAAGGAS